MSAPPDAATGGTVPEGIVNRRSPWPVDDTVRRLVAAIEGAGAKVFATIDHSGEAARAGLLLRDTKVVVFGNPVAGTPLMEATPLIALDLPLKVLVWHDDDDGVWMTYLDSSWLAERYGVAPELVKVLAAVDALVRRVLDSSN